MSIHALPSESVRSLGSGQVITTPLTVLKELLENSLDASATAISLEASPDLTSVLICKDNGTGIRPEDRPLMAVRYCTSKIESFEDISDVATLGFRGEALASLVAVSGGLSIATRVEGEVVGVGCEIGRDGKIVRQSSITMPIGTAVKVISLFQTLPVRQATIEKTAQKILPQIRPLLVSYYLTHPHIRLSFKLIPSPNAPKKQADTKCNIVFPPSKSVEEAFRKSIGKDAAIAGSWHRYPPEEDLYADHGIILEAYIPKPKEDVDGSHIPKKGIHISFLGRPLSIERPDGIAKQIYSLYKKHINASSLCSGSGKIVEPYIYMNILTDRKAADVNIEPAKDNILFEDAGKIMGVIKQFFEEIYGELSTQESGTVKNSGGGRGVVDVDSVDFGLLMSGRGRRGKSVQREEQRKGVASAVASIDFVRPADTPRRKATEESNQTPLRITSSARRNESSLALDRPQSDIHTSLSPNTAAQSSLPAQSVSANLAEGDDEPAQVAKFGLNMFDSGEVDEGIETNLGLSKQGDDSLFIDEEDSEKEDVSTSNPWTVAKMNAGTIRTSSSSIPSSAPPNPMRHASNTSRTTLASSVTTCLSDSNQDGPNLESSSRQNIQITPGLTPVRTRKELWFPSFGSNSGPGTFAGTCGTGFGPSPSSSTRKNTRHQASASFLSAMQSSDPQGDDADVPRSSESTSRQRTMMDAWAGQNRDHTPMSVSQQAAQQMYMPALILSSPSARPTFGRPDRRMSNIPGDGGRGLFPSASDRVAQRRGAAGDNVDEDDDNEISSDDLLLLPAPAAPKPAKTSPHKNRQAAARAALSQPFPRPTTSSGSSSRFKSPLIALNNTPTSDDLHDSVLTLQDINLDDIQSHVDFVECLGQDKKMCEPSTRLLQDIDGLAESLLACIVRNMERIREEKVVGMETMPEQLVKIWRDGKLDLIVEIDIKDELTVLGIPFRST